MAETDIMELKFRLYDGSDIGPIQYSSASTIGMLKEKIVAEWPKDKEIVPKVANDVKLISAGKILDNNKTISQFRQPFGDLPAPSMIMHIVVQPSPVKQSKAKKVEDLKKKSSCTCSSRCTIL